MGKDVLEEKKAGRKRFKPERSARGTHDAEKTS